MEPYQRYHKILKEGDYVVKEGDEEVTFYNTVVGSLNADEAKTTLPFRGIVNEIDRTAGMSEFMSIRILTPKIFTDFEVPVSKSDNSNIQLRKVNSHGAQAPIPGGGRRKQRKKRTKKKSRKKKKKTLRKKRKRRKKKRKTRR